MSKLSFFPNANAPQPDQSTIRIASRSGIQSHPQYLAALLDSPAE
jgi:hypothetical protein